MLWIRLFPILAQLRSLFPRKATFFVFVTAVIGLMIRTDLRGVTSIIRALDLKPAFYKSLLRLFRTNIDPGRLADAWTRVVFTIFAKHLVRVNGRVVLMVDGLKVPKEGKRMPAVKSLHQESENNSKPSFIMGHMFQSVAILVEGIGRRFAVPLSSRIHEGLKVNNKDRKTLVDKLGLEVCWLPIKEPFLVLADAYYCAANFVGLIQAQGGHVITVARTNAVAFEVPEAKPRGRGRPPIYGAKVKLVSQFDGTLRTATVNAYGQDTTEVRYWTRDLIWKGTSKLVRYVGAIFPNGKRAILMCTDTALTSEAIIEAYAARMRIEQGFKVLLHNIGAYSYHFWTKAMKKIKRRSKGQFIHHEPEEIRSKMFETHGACELFVACGLIAQGLLQYLAVAFPAEVRTLPGKWYRSQLATMSPTEEIVQDVLRQELHRLREGDYGLPNYTKFLASKMSQWRCVDEKLIKLPAG
jgi:DDE superfamily endonuclease